jgi:hypothetical protein
MKKNFVLLIVYRINIFNQNILTVFAETFHSYLKKVMASVYPGLRRVTPKPYCLYTVCTLSVQ